MGAACVSGRKKYVGSSSGDEEPSDTAALAATQADLPPLNFQIKLSNVRLKGVPYQQREVSVEFYLLDILEHKLNAQDPIDNEIDPESLKWTFEKQASFAMNEYQLRRAFLMVHVKHLGVKVAEMQFNLFLIATGPYHLDFPIKYSNRAIGRICVDVRLSQMLNSRIETKFATVTLIKQRPGQTFNYSVKTIVKVLLSQSNHNKEYESDHSYNQKLSLESTFREELEASRTKNHKLVVSKQVVESTIEELHKIYWDCSGALRSNARLPFINAGISVSELHNLSLQFLMWVVDSEPKSSRSKQQKTLDVQHTYSLTGECYISFGKILQRDFEEATNDGMVCQNRQVEVTQKLWNRGKHIGQVRLHISVSIPRFFRQMVVYIRSEQGLQTLTPFYTHSSEKGQCSEIVSIIRIQKHVDQTLEELSSLHSKGKASEMRVRLLKQEIYENLCEILKVLQCSKKESVILYGYSSEKDLLRGQEALIDVGFKLAQCIEEDDNNLHDICWKCLIALMKRGQLTLRCLGFTDDEKREISDNQPKKPTKKKIEVGLRVQSFFYKMIGIVLECLTKKAIQDNERMFVELFCAYSFFRIPEFRQRIVQVISKPQDELEKEPQARRDSFDQNRSNELQTLDMLFNWDQNFYKPLSNDPRYINNLRQLQQVLNQREWIHRMEKRGVAFFYFVFYWMKYVEQTLIISESVKWDYLPCYSQLVSAVLGEMRKRPLLAYPDSLRDASTRLLANERLLNKLMYIVFQKTNLFDCATVIKCTELLDGYFSFLENTGRCFPTAFNYAFFLAGIKKMLESDHCFAVSKSLLLIYKHFNLLSFDCRRDITFFLLSKPFFKMFLNWSYNVRVVFQHLLMFRIYLQANALSTTHRAVGGDSSRHQGMAQKQLLYNEEVKKRYQTLMCMLENCIRLREEQETMKFASNYEKDFARRMRKKLNEKKKLMRQGNNRESFMQRNVGVDLERVSVRQAQKQAQRYHSEVIPSVIVTYPHEFLNQKDSHDITMSPTRAADTPNTRKLSIEIPNAVTPPSIRKIRTNDQDFQMPRVESEQLSYLAIAISEFKAIEENYVKCFSKCTEINKVPTLKVKVPIDEAETRPENTDEW